MALFYGTPGLNGLMFIKDEKNKNRRKGILLLGKGIIVRTTMVHLFTYFTHFQIVVIVGINFTVVILSIKEFFLYRNKKNIILFG